MFIKQFIIAIGSDKRILDKINLYNINYYDINLIYEQ
jgi:hypothetical protein